MDITPRRGNDNCCIGGVYYLAQVSHGAGIEQRPPGILVGQPIHGKLCLMLLSVEYTIKIKKNYRTIHFYGFCYPLVDMFTSQNYIHSVSFRETG